MKYHPVTTDFRYRGSYVVYDASFDALNGMLKLPMRNEESLIMELLYTAPPPVTTEYRKVDNHCQGEEVNRFRFEVSC